ncbi:MAG: GDSL-type esterase/lipase family protein [Candidatus Nanopelagicales bacterium]
MTTRRRALAAVLAGTAAVVAFWGVQRTTPPGPSLETEVTRIGAMPFRADPTRPTVVVTGSSSIRLWQYPQVAFPGAQVVNTGFGGSTMADLAAHDATLIDRFRPELVVIHEGDNDLNAGRPPEQILRDTRAVLTDIATDLPTARVVLISAKPSPARWDHAAAYRELNAGYRRLARERPEVTFADMWPALLGTSGSPDPALYRDDGLHLDAAGYARWTASLQHPRFQP